MTNVTSKHEKVGILLVHGIGETKKFENVEAVARNITAALRSDKNLRQNVRVIINCKDDGEYGASQQIWSADDKASVVIEIKEHDPNEPNKVNKVTELFFHEVWWADLGKSNTLESQLSFWKWGLSLWSRKQFRGKKPPSPPIYPPKNIKDEKYSSIKLFDRLRFFVVSWVVLLILPVLYFLSIIFRRLLGVNIPVHILDQYLGDVKHYQQSKREGAGYLVDIGQPPRVSVRRRMVTGLVKMGLADYDRWYVLAHSLGTVVAFNGLMETEETLPNYLNEDLWNKLKKPDSSINTKAEDKDKKKDKKTKYMFPRRPAWLESDDIIARKDLFKNLKGVMTYGSPLSKFAVVWPAIVPINENSFFSSDFEWINIYDPTDPVADRTKYFDLENYSGKKPIEIAYKADSIHLLSHIKYLDYNYKRENPLVKQLAYWLLRGDKFQRVEKQAWGWPDNKSLVVKVYQSIRYLVWLVLALFISWILSYFVSQYLSTSIKNTITQATHLDISNPLLYFLGTATIVFFFGIFARLNDDRRQSLKNLEMSR